MEHRLELNTQGVTGRSLAVPVDQYRNAAVNGFRDIRVAPRAEDGARSRVGIQQPDVERGLSRRNVPILVLQLLHTVGKKDKVFRLRRRRLFAAKIEDGELEGRMNLREESCSLFEIMPTIDRFDSATATKKSLVVMSDAMPEGNGQLPTRPCGATSW